jgi:hypothetical protein
MDAYLDGSGFAQEKEQGHERHDVLGHRLNAKALTKSGVFFRERQFNYFLLHFKIHYASGKLQKIIASYA